MFSLAAKQPELKHKHETELFPTVRYLI